MKIVKNKNPKKLIIVIITVIVLLAAGLSVYYYIQSTRSTTTSPNSKSDNSNTKKTNDINFSPPTSEETAAGQAIKKNSIDPKSTTNTDSSPISVSLQGKNNGSQVVFDTLIQAISNDGQCNLSITSGGQTILKTSNTFANPSSSSCEGFSVSTSELPKGIWSATLTVTIGSRSGTSKADISVGS